MGECRNWGRELPVAPIYKRPAAARGPRARRGARWRNWLVSALRTSVGGQQSAGAIGSGGQFAKLKLGRPAAARGSAGQRSAVQRSPVQARPVGPLWAPAARRKREGGSGRKTKAATREAAGRGRRKRRNSARPHISSHFHIDSRARLALTYGM